ncbi:hypothetical protein KAR91_36250 [Candidatus Pacearchaeota archaeon]|nr:hypothetical protein [Candidatus Pacearchaeota archaeon]
MDQGWIKLYRKSIESRVFQNEGLWKVWTWCLLKVNHSGQWVSLRTGRGSIEVECQRGQFIFGRLSAAKELKMNPTTVWKRMQKLKNMGNIDIKSDSQYSVITLLNMGIYQPSEIKSDSKSDRQGTGKEQASDTNKNEKNEKNEKKKTFTLDSIEYQLSELLFTEIIKSNPEHKQPNLQTWSKDIDKMMRLDNRQPDNIKQIILWCQKDSFWQCNILSTKKLREKYDQLLIKMNGNGKGGYKTREERNAEAKEEFLSQTRTEIDITPMED